MHARGVSGEVAACGFRCVCYSDYVVGKAFETKISVRCQEFIGGHFSEVGNVLKYGIFNRDLKLCPLKRVCPLLEVFIIFVRLYAIEFAS